MIHTKKIYMAAIMAVFVLLIILVLIMRITKNVVEVSSEEFHVEDDKGLGDEVYGLYCLADTEEEAKKIADAYGIEFLKFEVGIAVFKTHGDARKIIEKGKKEGFPELYIDQKIHLD